jgi:CRISPR/Cas system CSM-associated protein Csm3 (group 7 of RAMP superfamily)
MSRPLAARWVICGKLELESPLAIGGEDAMSPLDRPVLRDAEGHFIITGESLAGALGSYLLDREAGYGQGERNTARARQLLGFEDRVGGHQSSLTVYDAFATGISESRDGIMRDPKEGTTVDKKKYDYEVVPVGTIFEIRFDLAVLFNDDTLKTSLAYLADEVGQLNRLGRILEGLDEGKIRFGRYKRKGLGQCKVHSWRYRRYDLMSPQGWEGFAASDHQSPLAAEPSYTNLAAMRSAWQMAGFATAWGAGRLESAQFHMYLEPVGGLLIGGGPGEADRNPVTSNGQAVITGTSLNGALKQRTRTILNTRGMSLADWLYPIFGPDPKDDTTGQTRKNLRASRVESSEGALKDATALLVSRVAIDSFTGGAADQKFFDAATMYGGHTYINLRLFKDPQRTIPFEAEIGLLLLTLRDLIDEDLVIGGSGAIGWGRCQGYLEVTWGGKKGRLSTLPSATDLEMDFLEGLIVTLNEAQPSQSAKAGPS